ncbi:hypothetical protein [Pedobacter agri]|uniref:hypothetical protein n=1 Tax=Pedobacter agri TaxID=454586 RepID=UPI00277DEA7B|nr:hypothetical protein [Pedobacter agri]MDQ1139438.1 hypothetical protein [Pedobacter agri]
MKTGIELIAIERQEQIEKHGRTVEKDIELYRDGYGNMSQLTFVAEILIKRTFTNPHPPKGFDEVIFNKMISKPYKERLIIAGALIAAEIDMINLTK